MKRTLILFIILMLALVPITAFAQTGTIAGKVTIEKTGDPLPNAAVFLGDAKTGTYTQQDGSFILKNVAAGSQEVTASFMGYKQQTKEIMVSANETNIVNFALEIELISIEGIAVVSDRATVRETPVAFTDIDKEKMESQLGSRDIPLVLVSTPSVYSTVSGGGAGDARINVRGFDQRNVSVMINGVPVNDMENGWVYWSNWDGVGDATSSIQVQRGLSAVNLATPSIGGTMNIITDPTGKRAGTKFKQEYGTAGFLKSTLSIDTGLLNDKFALSLTGVRKSGDGLADKTWTDAWAYYLSSSYIINDNNKLEFYAVGAPQRHGQNLYMQNIAVYDRDYAKDLDGYDEAAFDQYSEGGRYYNQNWGPVSNKYRGQQWWDGKLHNRYAENFINERENYYHKPQINLNWYTKLSEKLNLYSIIYYSGGKGGGTGTLGSIRWNYSTPTRTADWDATIAINDTCSTGSKGILRNSVNSQWSIGLISKAYYTINEDFQTSVGIDWRTAEIDHFREVRDLLGGDYYIDNSNEFDTTAEDKMKVLGDKVAYHFTNTVDWMGGYWQGEYSKEAVTAYLMGGMSAIKYTYLNHFKSAVEDDLDSGKLEAETDWITGYQVKGGSSYRINEYLDAYGNAGYVSKVPIFDDVIDDGNGTKADDPKNEKFTAFEAGLNYTTLDEKLGVKSNFYFTNWQDKSRSIGINEEDGSEGLIFISGMDSRHMGFEFETNYRPVYLVQFDLAASIGEWIYTDDVSATYDNYDSPSDQKDTLNIYVKDLKVGNAPQTQFSLGTTLMPIDGLKAQLVMLHFMDHYADFNAFDRDDPDDTEQSWKLPDYTKFDLHVSYDLPVGLKGVDISLFAHLFNVFDAVFVQDAVDNSSYNGWDHDHDADDAEVYLGLPRTFNAGFQLSF
ncbi:MAG: TonB-dependent receptor [Candidatus Cloacimonas sp. SDB]|nr:MAG: TonB-dependent receptor [Candidatus Cloacimonas sp. SDB]